MYWKTSSITDVGTVNLNFTSGTGTFDPGVIADGQAANGTGNTANAVNIGGDAGSAVLLNQDNTFTGLTTVNANATARASHAGAFGTTAAGTTVTSGGAIELSGGITIGAEALTLNGTGVSSNGALRNTSGNNTWQGNVTLGSASRIASDSGTLTLSGTVTHGGNRLTILGSSGVTISGNASGTGSSDILKQGSGTLTLSGDNSGLNPTGSNSMYIDQGTVYLNHNSAGGASGKTIDLGSGIAGGSGFTASLYAIGGRTIANAITIQGENSATLNIGSDSTADDNSFTGNVAIEKTANFNAGSGRTVTFSTGVLSGAGGVTKTGLGTVILSANNTYTGGTTVSAGTLQIGAGSTTGSITGNIINNSVLIFNRSNEDTYNGAISGTGTFTKSGSGKLTLGGANTFSGKTTISGGTVSVAAASGLGANPGSTVADQITLNGGALEVTTGFSANANAGITIGGNGGTISVASGQTLTQGGGLNGSGALSKTGAGTLTLGTTAGNYSGTMTISGGVVRANTSLTGATVTVASGGRLGGSGSLGAVTVQSGGGLTPGNSPGNLSVSSLTLSGGGFYDWEITDATGAAGTGWDVVTVGSGTGAITLNATSTNKYTINIIGTTVSNWASSTSRTWDIIDAGSWVSAFDATAFGFDTTQFSPTATGIWSVANNGGNLQLVYTASATQLNSGSETVTQASAISGGAVDKIGSGTYILNNSGNSYTGITTISDGTLQIDVAAPINSNGALGNANSAVVVGAGASAVSFSFGAAVTNSRDLSIVAGGTRTISTAISSGTATQAGAVAMAADTTYTSSTSGGTLLVSGAISGAGNATVSGSGTVEFSGNNSYSGTTTINSGTTLRASHANALGGTGSGTTVNSGGTLSLVGAGTGDALNLSGTGVGSGGALRNVSGNNTVSGAVTLAGTTRINADAGTLTLDVATGNAISGTQNLTFGGAGNITVADPIATSTATVTKDGAGALTLSGANTFSGGLTLSAGTINLNNAAAAGTGAFTISGGTLDNTTAGSITLNNNTQNWNGDFAFTGTQNLNLGTGAVSMNASRQLTINGGTLTVGGAISGAGFGLTKTGSGSLTLSGANTFTGVAVVNAGTLTLSGGSAIADTTALTVNDGTLVVSGAETVGALSGSGGSITLNAGLTTSFANDQSYAGTFTGSSSLSKTGSGALTLSGNSTGYTGEVILNNGTLLAGNAGAFGTGTVTINFDTGTGTRALASSSATAYTLNNNFNLYYNAFTLGQTSGGTGSLTLGGAGKTFFLGSDGTATTRVVTVNGSHTIAAQITGGANNRLSKTGSGTLALTGANTFSGGVTLSDGTLRLGDNAALGTGGLSLNGGTLASDSATARTLGNTVTIGGNLELGEATTGTGGLTFNGAVGLSGGIRQLTVNQETTFAGAVTNGSLTKAGSAQLNLGNASTSFSTLTVNAGTVSFSENGAITGLQGAGTVNLASTKTLTATLGSASSFTGLLTGSGTLTKAGSAALTLSGNSTGFSGETILNNGTLLAGNAGAFGTGTITINHNDGTGSRTLAAADANSYTLNNNFNLYYNSFTLGQTSGGTGSLTLGGAGKTFNLGSDGSEAIRVVTVNGSHTIAGEITGGSNNRLAVAGGGTLILSGANTFSGGIRIREGTLSITNANSLGSGSLGLGNAGTTATLLVNSNTTISNRLEITDSSSAGVINVASGTTTTISGILSQTNGTANTTKIGKDGEGTLVMNNGSGTYNGQIQVGRGTLVVGATGALGGNNSTVNRGIDLGLNVGDTSTANDVSVLASNNVIVAQSFYVAPNTSGAKRTVGLAGSGTNTFSNEFFLHGNLTVDAGAASSDRVNLTGKITSTGGLIKTGSGTAVLSGSTANDFSGNTTINQGTLQLQKTGVEAISSGTIAVNGGTLLLGAANQIGSGVAIDMSGGTVLDTGGFSDQVGQLRFTGSGVTATIKGLAAGDNGSFIFSDLETASIGRLATSVGGVGGLTFSGSGYDFTNGFKIKLFSTDISSTLTSNNFSTKISFEGASQVGAISFTGGSSTYLNVAAIPEPKVYVAAGALAVLIAFAEVRRRKKIVSSKA